MSCFTPWRLMAPCLTLLLNASACSIQITASNLTASSDSISAPPAPLVVQALYPVSPATDPEWNYYVKSNGTSEYDADNTPCNAAVDIGYDGCIHAGEKKTFTVPGVSSCAGLTAADQRGAFDWVCDATSGIATFYSSGLKAGKGLGDLIDPATGTEFLTNYVTVSGVTPVRQSEPEIWWNNPIEPLPDNSASTHVVLDGVDSDGATNIDQAFLPGTILTLLTSRVTPGFNINAHQLSVVIMPGVTLQWNGGTTGTADGTSGEYIAGGLRNIIAAGSQNFIWVEGDFNSAGAWPAQNAVFLWGIKFSRLNQVSARNAGAPGTAYNIYSSGSSRYNRFTGITASNVGQGFSCEQSSASLVDGLTGITSVSWPVYFHACNGWTVRNVTGTSNGGATVMLRSGSSSNTFENITTDQSSYGIYLFEASSNNTFRTIRATNTSNQSIAVINGAYSLDNNSFYDVRAANTSAVFFWHSGGNRLVRAHLSNIRGIGVSAFDAPYTVLSDITIAGVGQTMGSHNAFNIQDNSHYSVVTRSLAAHVVNWAFYVGAPVPQAVVVHNFVAHNSTGGISVALASSTFSQIASTHNDNNTVAINAGSSGVKFTGNLLIGNNSTVCSVDGTATNPGLVSPGCANQGSSDATLHTILGTATNYVGKVDATQTIPENQLDATNASDTGGTVAYATTLNWLSFDHWLRGWGRDGGAFPNSTNRYKCSADGGYETCRIWDFRLKASGTLLRDTTGTGNSSNSTAFDIGNTCPQEVWGDQVLTTESYTAPASGATWVTDAFETAGVNGNEDGICDAGESCFKRYLKNAVEILDPVDAGYSANGNHDGLCENGESCLYTPNFGSYQGHGTYGSCTFQLNGGAVSGVSIYGYEINGVQ